MELYKKPVVLLNEELAEGVYAASGAVDESAGSSGVSVAGVSLTNEGNEYYKVSTYTVTIKNSGSQPATDWSVSVSVTFGVATEALVYNGDLAKAALNGSKITIAPGPGGAIPAGGSIEVPVVVSYSSNSITIG